MNSSVLALLLIPSLAMAGDGAIGDKEVALAGVAIGDSRDAVVAKLGKPLHQEEAEDFLDLHYDYPHVRVSFNADIVAGLHSDDPKACTPKGLCPGDGLDKMRALYGAPKVSDRETGRVYEYYGPDGACWLEVPAKGTKVSSLTAVCLP